MFINYIYILNIKLAVPWRFLIKPFHNRSIHEPWTIYLMIRADKKVLHHPWSMTVDTRPEQATARGHYASSAVVATKRIFKLLTFTVV